MNNLEQIAFELKKSYQTSDPIYVSDILNHDKKWLHDRLSSLYRPVFDNNFRILVIQDVSDRYPYQDLPGTAVTELQKVASQIDISNFFIVVISYNQNIGIELNKVREMYSSDPVTIKSITAEGEYSDIDTNKKQDTFCVLPWVHLYIGPDGNVLPCCVADTQHPMGNINEQSVKTILQSEKFNNLRKNMLAGERSKECSRCYLQEDSNIFPSIRQKHNAAWPDISASTVDPSGELETVQPVYLDIRINNICNLKCRMCSGYFSSSIAQEEASIYGNKKSIDNSMRNKQRQMALSEVVDLLPHVESIYFAGGEPLLALEHYEILKALIKCKNTDLEIFYSTNFTNLTYNKQSILKLWKKFSNVNIAASLDGWGPVAEYIRHGTDWKTIEENLNLLKDSCQHVKFMVVSTLGFLNVDSVIELQYTWHVNNIVPLTNFSVEVMLGPDHMTLAALPDDYKYALTSKIIQHMKWCKSEGAMELAKQWQSAIDYMMSKDDSHALVEFTRITKTLDNYRNESFKQVFPMYQGLLRE
jgi:radical SAM protein with 4Fe4S-binding SPASM domain